MTELTATERVILKAISVAPLQNNENLRSFNRLPDEVRQVTNILVNSPGGCLLVTGYRGVGKTSFVNKVLFEADEKLKNDNKQAITVRLNLARGYSTDKLLRRLIRELFYEINRAHVFDRLPLALQNRLRIAFLRTSQQIKTAFAQGLKEVIAQTSSETATEANSYTLAPSIGIDKLEAALGSMARHRQRSQMQEETKSRETSEEQGVEIGFLEYDDEIAENDLSGLIDELVNCEIDVSAPIAATQRYEKVTRKPQFIWRQLPAEMRLGNRLIRNYWERPIPSAAPPPPPHLKKLKIVFVLDEIDKMTVKQAEEIFRSLKNLFLKGNVTFILVSGKEFYYEWLLKRTTEDDILFSLFTGVFHVPLFQDEELKNLVSSLQLNAAQPFPDDVLNYLLYRARGTPREFLRTLLRNVYWEDENPVLIPVDTLQVDVANRLYPYLVAVFNPIASNNRIDLGIQDHLRRHLHSWLDRMITAVIFEKEYIFNPFLSQPGDGPSYEFFFRQRLRETFDQFFNLLLTEGVLQIDSRIGESVYYTFAEDIRDRLDKIDSSGTGELLSEIKALHKEFTELLVTARKMANEGDYEQVLDRLQPFASPSDVKIQDEELVRLQNELQKLWQEAEGVVKSRELMRFADKQLSEARYEQAAATYQELLGRGINLPDLEDKFYLAQINSHLHQLQIGLMQDAEKKEEISHYLRKLIDRARSSNNPQVIALVQQAREVLKRNEEIVVLLDRIEKSDTEGAIEAFEELTELVSNPDQIPPQLERKIRDLRADLTILYNARQQLKAGNLDEIQSSLLNRRPIDIQIGLKIQHIRDVSLELKSLLSDAERAVQQGDLQAAQEFLREVQSFVHRYSIIKEQLPEYVFIEEKLRLGQELDRLRKEIDRYLEEGDLDTAWDILEQIGEISPDTLVYTRTRRKLEDITISKAQQEGAQIIEVVREVQKTQRFQDVAITAVEIDLIVGKDRVARILSPLLAKDPDNLRAMQTLQAVEKAVDAIQNSENK
jgi:Cdc6-like AAA superfamily ATPase